jgi:hypothetical protein
MRSPKWFLAWLLTLGAFFVGVQPAQADPLPPLSPAEIQYLDQLHRVFSLTHDPVAFRGDGELLTRGRFVCYQRDQGLVGEASTHNSPVITQLALIYLCPR